MTSRDSTPIFIFDMRIRIILNTHERPNKLLRLFRQLAPQLEEHDAKVYVQNDASMRSYQEAIDFFRANFEGDFVRYPRNHGRMYYWMLVNKLFTFLEGDEFDYCFKLDDDIQVTPDFINTMITMFEAIDNESKVALNPFTCDKNLGAKIWTPIEAKHEKHGGFSFYKVGWVDMVWLAIPKFFDLLDYTIQSISPKTLVDRRGHSSGVGRQISWRIVRRQHIFYQCETAQIYHGAHESQMHKERRQNGIHLITNNHEDFNEQA